MKVRNVIPMKNDKSSTFMFNGGDNDECYTPREGVEPLLKYLEGMKIGIKRYQQMKFSKKFLE